MEPQAPEIRDAGAGPRLSLLLMRFASQSRRGLALMIFPEDVSTSVCLSRDADDSSCKHTALAQPRNPRD